MENLIGIGVMVAIIILASSVHKLIDRKHKANVPGEAENRILTRLDELDRRITEVQDVMITIDEKLSRARSNS